MLVILRCGTAYARLSDTMARSKKTKRRLTGKSLMNAFTKTLQTLLLLQETRGDTKSDPVMIEAVALPSAA
jgi:hypothetical protein